MKSETSEAAIRVGSGCRVPGSMLVCGNPNLENRSSLTTSRPSRRIVRNSSVSRRASSDSMTISVPSSVTFTKRSCVTGSICASLLSRPYIRPTPGKTCRNCEMECVDDNFVSATESVDSDAEYAQAICSRPRRTTASASKAKPRRTSCIAPRNVLANRMKTLTLAFSPTQQSEDLMESNCSILEIAARATLGYFFNASIKSE